MRIWYQYPTPVNEFRRGVVWDSIQTIASRVKRPDTEIEIFAPKRAPAEGVDGSSHFARHHADGEIMRTIAGASNGYDAAIVGVSSDSGIVVAKEILDIPVVGLTEAACHYATLWGHKFGVIRNAWNGTHGLAKEQQRRRELLASYGVLDRCLGVVPMDMPNDRYRQALADRDHDEILTVFERHARDFIARGADVIVTGDTILSMALVEHDFFEVPGTGVVVVDLISCAIKLAESLVDIHKAFGIVRSRGGIYESTPSTTPNDVASAYF